ncbi:MAG: WYL domain-containing protein [gamma proteobacterium symbiont of Bathyaustriella thionipta]|nr:WYL domain-containing protein [gamma proteobacterium symbiont of Bathyaustriella thionipta]
MSENFIRRIRILEMLKRKDDGVITIPQIIQRLSAQGIEVSRSKTVERDMMQLSAEFNIGCDDTKRPFHWWWAGKDSIDIPGMGRNSALAFRLAQQYLEPLLPRQSLEHLQPRFRQSRKILHAKGKQKERRWVNKIRVVPKALQQIPARVSGPVQTAVYEALYEEKMLQLDYQPAGHEPVSQRRIHPLGLIYRGLTLELVCYEEGDDIIKRFILNRIKKAQVQIQSLITPPDFDLDEYIQTRLGFPGSCKKIQFKAWLHQYARPYVEETPLTQYQSIQEQSDGHIILSATVRDTVNLRTWILSLGPRIQVLQPEFLKQHIAEEIKAMAELYEE